MRFRLPFVCAAALSLAAAVAVAAQEQSAPPGAPSPEDMQKMMELASPGPHHGHLAALAGRWDVVGKFRMVPDMPWQESRSVGTLEPVMGGRFLHQHYLGDPMPGMPTEFEGVGYLGFDNQKQKYVSVWMDNLGTMMMSGEGTCEADGRTITVRSEFFDPMTNKPSYLKSVYKVESPDRFVTEMHCPGPDGKEFLMVELVHTRKK